MYFIRIGPTLLYLKNSNVFFFLFVLVSADRKVINHTGDSDLLVNPFMQTK